MTQTVFGIDLGTTNSCLAVVRDGVPEVIAIDDQPVVPSVVSLDEATGELVVGVRARNRAALYPELTVSSIKRRMGSEEPVQLGSRSLLPEEVSAEILRYLARHGEAAVGEPVRQVVITVPAFFDDAQRRATIRAGELAGLEVLRILNEPTAAALVYQGVQQRAVDALAGQLLDGAAGGRDDNVLVYDLGGGTFDVSVLRVDGDLYRVGASAGDTQLGGDDFDQELVEELLQRLDQPSLADDRLVLARLKAAAERAKIELSLAPFTTVMEEALARGVHLNEEISRETLQSRIESSLQRTLAAVDKALGEAKMTPADLDRVLLVGGSTRIPLVAALLAEHLERPAEHSIDPDLCVALGAAVHGAILGGAGYNRILVDVSAHSLGVKTLDVAEGALPGEADYFSVIIPRNSQVPVVRSDVYYTVSDRQECVVVEVYQGESVRCSENSLIGEFLFKLKPAPRGAEVEVQLGYDLEGVVHVVVSQRGKDNRTEVTLSSRGDGSTVDWGVADDVAETAADFDNFILRKARAMTAELPAGELRERLVAACEAYAAVVADDDAEDDAVDSAEDDLLDVLEEAELMLSPEDVELDPDDEPETT